MSESETGAPAIRFGGNCPCLKTTSRMIIVRDPLCSFHGEPIRLIEGHRGTATFRTVTFPAWMRGMRVIFDEACCSWRLRDGTFIPWISEKENENERQAAASE
jgi:hypothetical protein